jgi:molybdate transport system ATP-binding protein
VLDVDIRKRLATITIDLRLSLTTEVVALFGPSGAGKSMTLKLIAGIERPDDGVIRAGERVLFDASAGIDLPPQRRRVGYVPQHYALFPHLSALENVTLPLRKGLRWKAARAEERGRELLESFGLGDRLAARPGHLSGGQQQRVALARALAIEPDILLLDEPFSALDAPVRSELRREFRAMQARLRIPAIFVTHDLEEAASVASRLAVVLDGRIHQDAPVRELLDRPADRRVAELVQARNIVSGTVVRNGSSNALVRTGLGDFTIGPTLYDNGAAVYVIIRPEALRIVRDDRPFDRLRDHTLLSGTTREIIDHGMRTIVYADINGHPLEVALSSSATQRLDLRPGQPLRLSVPPNDVWVVPDSR